MLTVDFDRQYWRRMLKFFVMVLVVAVIAGVITYLVTNSPKQGVETLNRMLPDSVKHQTGLSQMWAYIMNNAVRVPLTMLVFALIPIPFLYTISVVATAASIGILIGSVSHSTLKVVLAVALGLVPHGFFELGAFCFWAAALYCLNRWLCQAVYHHKRKQSTTFLFELKRVALRYLVIVLPLMILAAFMETFVSVMVINLVLK